LIIDNFLKIYYNNDINLAISKYIQFWIFNYSNFERRIIMEETKTQFSADELLNFNIIEEFDNGESSFLAKKYYLMTKLMDWILS